MNTTENNKIIDKFNNNHLTNLNGFECYYNKENRSYNNDWNLLMQVVEKCYNTKESYNLHKDIEDAFIYKVANRIEAVYNACLEFIKSYNEAMEQEAVYSIRG